MQSASYYCGRAGAAAVGTVGTYGRRVQLVVCAGSSRPYPSPSRPSRRSTWAGSGGRRGSLPRSTPICSFATAIAAAIGVCGGSRSAVLMLATFSASVSEVVAERGGDAWDGSGTECGGGGRDGDSARAAATGAGGCGVGGVEGTMDDTGGACAGLCKIFRATAGAGGDGCDEGAPPAPGGG